MPVSKQRRGIVDVAAKGGGVAGKARCVFSPPSARTSGNETNLPSVFWCCVSEHTSCRLALGLRSSAGIRRPGGAG